MILVLINQREFTTESNSTRLSIMRFYVEINPEADMKKEKPYLVAFLKQDLIIFAQSDTKYDRCDIFKTMDPLLPLAPLATDVEHAMCPISHALAKRSKKIFSLYTQLAHGESCLINAGSLCSSSQYISLDGNIVGRSDSQSLLEEAAINQSLGLNHSGIQKGQHTKVRSP